MTAVHRTVSVRITGRVQGVGFRAWVRRQADELGLRGWVRNEPDGSVSALLVGLHEDVEAMLAQLGQGPPGARVRRVDAQEVHPAEAPAHFRVAR